MPGMPVITQQSRLFGPIEPDQCAQIRRKTSSFTVAFTTQSRDWTERITELIIRWYQYDVIDLVYFGLMCPCNAAVYARQLHLYVSSAVIKISFHLKKKPNCYMLVIIVLTKKKTRWLYCQLTNCEIIARQPNWNCMMLVVRYCIITQD